MYRASMLGLKLIRVSKRDNVAFYLYLNQVVTYVTSFPINCDGLTETCGTNLNASASLVG